MGRLGVVGGGATGAALAWALSQDPKVAAEWEVVLLHEGGSLGGHSMTVEVDYRGVALPVDIGVQFISPMLYPNVHVMLGMPAFSDVPVTAFDALQVACAFPRSASGQRQNWGNFPAYQAGNDFALYDLDMSADANMFQNFVQFAFDKSWLTKTLAEYFADPPQAYTRLNDFVAYFISPFMSIMNGYGSADLDQVTFEDIIPLFALIPGEPTPLAALTHPGTGWQRFTNGSSTWVDAMVSAAQRSIPVQTHLGATVSAVWTDLDTPSRPVDVEWTDITGAIHVDVFDKVVLTTDMWTNAQLLDNDRNASLWNGLYVDYVAKDLWPLMYGACYIHSDPSLLSPDLTQQQETLQFTAYYAPQAAYPYYDISHTYTTYMLANLMQSSAATGLYLTMYGDVTTEGTKLPNPNQVFYEQQWTHGKWAASFMSPAKKSLHTAQGLGTVAYPGQQDTNLYFAGNNTTTDSEEGALISALAMANYLFGSVYPWTDHLEASLMYELLRSVMFPDPAGAS